MYFTIDRGPDVHEPTIPEDWELVVGLEVHVELSTNTKLFCGCANTFGAEPNTNICPTCLGLPGSLPVMNEAAVRDAMRLGRALNCTVSPSVMARKNYFYPDMPKDFQTSQYDKPTNSDGWLDLPDGTRISIERAHIEEDTGKSTHVGGDGRITSAQYSLIDYNRAGVPLLEIVSRPDIRTADEAKAYVSELRGILLALDVSDAKMEEGSMRVDANVSVRPRGSDELRTRCEIKNINSISSIGRAIAHEANRHIDLYDTGERPIQETRHWDEEAGRTRPGRSKENEEDYRYFPEPDLTPLVPTTAELDAIDASIPVLPGARRARLAEAAGIAPIDASLIVERGDAEFALAAIDAGADAGRVVVHLNNNLADGTGELSPESFAALVALETSGDLSSTQTKDVLAEMVESGGAAADIAAAKGFEAMDTGELENILDGLVSDHADQWVRFCGADEGDSKKMAGFFTGQIMKATRGQADGKVVAQLLNSRRRD
jgi:aspartyl-tRNA(Asn)/glutamyl-tRNA(Gln) amidotransferase subunit B